MPSQSSLNGYLAAIGAAGGVGAFVLLLKPNARSLAVFLAIAVLLIGLGVVAWVAGDWGRVL